MKLTLSSLKYHSTCSVFGPKYSATSRNVRAAIFQELLDRVLSKVAVRTSAASYVKLVVLMTPCLQIMRIMSRHSVTSWRSCSSISHLSTDVSLSRCLPSRRLNSARSAYCCWHSGMKHARYLLCSVTDSSIPPCFELFSIVPEYMSIVQRMCRRE